MKSKEYRKGYLKACEDMIRLVDQHSKQALKSGCEKSITQIKESLQEGN